MNADSQGVMQGEPGGKAARGVCALGGIVDVLEGDAILGACAWVES